MIDLYLLLVLVGVLLVLAIYFVFNGCVQSEHMTAEQHTHTPTHTHTRPPLWAYWELKPGKTSPPPYIVLCLETIRRNCASTYDVRILNEISVRDYLPDLRTDIDQLGLAMKADYIRVALLHRYGGVWLDADTIAITDLREIRDKLADYDYVGFGCTGLICHTGYPRPSNWAMGSRRHGLLMGKVLVALDQKLDDHFATPPAERRPIGYFDLGKVILWDTLEKLMSETNYTYYHFPATVDGSRDVDGRWVTPDLIFSGDRHLMAPSELILVFLANNIYCGSDPKYNWFCTLRREEILTGPYFISGLFRRALGLGAGSAESAGSVTSAESAGSAESA